MIYSHKGIYHKCDETKIFFGGLAWSHKQRTGVGAERPVAVLARTVNALEWLFVEQHAEAVVASHLLHQRHDEHVVIHCQITFFVYWSQLKLVRSHLVVTSLNRNTQFECLNL